MEPLPQAHAEPDCAAPDRLGVWWLAPSAADRPIRQILKHHMKTPALVGTPIAPLRWPLGFCGLWEAGMGSPHPDQTFRGRQWALAPDHAWVRQEIVAHRVAIQLMKAFKVPGAMLLVASWRSQGLVSGTDSMALRLKVAGVMGDSLLLSTFQLEPGQTWAVVEGVRTLKRTNPGIDVVGASVEALLQTFFHQELSPEKQQAWRTKRRVWQLEEALPLPNDFLVKTRF